MKWIYFVFSILLFSCNSHNEHDGVYKADVFVDGSLMWVRTEVFEVSGNEVNLKTYSLDSTLLQEVKSTCTQFSDRIEILGKNGIVHIVRFDENGNLKSGEYTYRKVLNLQMDNKVEPEAIEAKTEDVGMWQGTRIFNDETRTYKRAVTITGTDVKITVLAGNKNLYEKEGKEFTTEYGYISGDKIYIKQGKRYSDQYYWFKDGELQVNYENGD